MPHVYKAIPPVSLQLLDRSPIQTPVHTRANSPVRGTAPIPDFKAEAASEVAHVDRSPCQTPHHTRPASAQGFVIMAHTEEEAAQTMSTLREVFEFGQNAVRTDSLPTTPPESPVAINAASTNGIETEVSDGDIDIGVNRSQSLPQSQMVRFSTKELAEVAYSRAVTQIKEDKITISGLIARNRALKAAEDRDFTETDVKRMKEELEGIRLSQRLMIVEIQGVKEKLKRYRARVDTSSAGVKLSTRAALLWPSDSRSLLRMLVWPSFTQSPTFLTATLAFGVVNTWVINTLIMAMVVVRLYSESKPILIEGPVWWVIAGLHWFPLTLALWGLGGMTRGLVETDAKEEGEEGGKAKEE